MKLPPLDSNLFEYEKAFDRNLGWLTAKEQQTLKNSCVAIAGAGGTGGFQAQVLARLGVGKFKIADPDTFELSNMNRQLGATAETLGRSKVDVLRQMILTINPSAQVETYAEKVDEHNIDSFLEGVQLAIDGIDFFELQGKFYLFRSCRERGIPAMTVCPAGFGATLMVFDPQGMDYETYFDLKPGMTDEQIRFAVMFGLTPSPFCLKYMSGDVVNTDNRRASSVAPGLMLTGAVTGAEAVKILTGKMKPSYCPHIFQVDLMTHDSVKKYYRWGMRSPWLKFKKMIAKMIFLRRTKSHAKKDFS